MAKRYRMSRGGSKRSFRRGASQVHPLNNSIVVHRGGYRA